MKAGFALPAVLFITGALCLALLAAVGAIDSLARSARDTVDRTNFEARALDFEARTTLALLTHPSTTNAVTGFDRRGRSESLAFDGTSYALGRNLEVSLQDEAGLVNLNALPVAAFPRLFAQFGVAPDAALTLADQLADYLDADDLIRNRGAEAAHYLAAGRPPPPNAALTSRAQLLGVLGWPTYASPDAWRRARELVVADERGSAVNINTSPEAVLMIRYGLSRQQAARAIQRRAVRPFATLEELGRAAGVRLVGDAERRVDRPNGRYRFSLVSTRSRQTYGSRIVLTPDDPSRPFRIEDRATGLLPPATQAQGAPHAAPALLAGN